MATGLTPSNLMDPFHNQDMQAHLFSAVEQQLRSMLIKNQQERITRVAISSILIGVANQEAASQFADKEPGPVELKERLSRASSRETLLTPRAPKDRRLSKEVSYSLFSEEPLPPMFAEEPSSRKNSLEFIMQEDRTCLEFETTDHCALVDANEDLTPLIKAEEFKALFGETAKYALSEDSVYHHTVEISLHCLALDAKGKSCEVLLPTHSWIIHRGDKCTYSMV